MNDSTWTWISGSKDTDQSGIYGEKGNANRENIPGARYSAVGWYDSVRRELWLFGGHGFGNSNSSTPGMLYLTFRLSILLFLK